MKRNFQFLLEVSNFFFVHFWTSSEKIQDVRWKTFNKFVKTSFYVSKRAVPWESIFMDFFKVRVFVCWGKLLPSFGRRFHLSFEIFILRVQRKTLKNFFLRWSFLSNFFAVWAIFLPTGKNHVSGLLKVPDTSPKEQFVGYKLLRKRLILFMFSDYERKKFRFWQFRPQNSKKMFFFVCPQKKSSNICFLRKMSDYEQK